MSGMCRYCCKSPKLLGGVSFERNEAKLCSPINMAPRPLAKPPVSFSRRDEVLHIFTNRISGLEKFLSAVEKDFCNKICQEPTLPQRTNYDDLACCFTVTGSVKENFEPSPTHDSTQIFPPCISIMRLEMASPTTCRPHLPICEKALPLGRRLQASSGDCAVCA